MKADSAVVVVNGSESKLRILGICNPRYFIVFGDILSLFGTYSVSTLINHHVWSMWHRDNVKLHYKCKTKKKCMQEPVYFNMIH